MYQHTTLSNGLRIVCETMKDVHSVSIGIWVGSGSRYEDPTYSGISHFVEHMLFKGTGKRTAKQIAEEIDAVGGQLNAFTTKEYTCFYAKLLSQHFDFGVDLLSDMVTNSTCTTADLEKEKLVILEEIKSFEDSPDEIIHDLLANEVLKGHPLGRVILGTPETVQRIDRKILLTYLKHNYTADNIVFAVAGNVQFSQVVAAVEEHLACLNGKTVRDLPILPNLDASIIIRAKDTEQVHICLGTRGVERKNSDKFGVFVLDSILGGSVSSRLFQQLREERGLVYATGSSHAAYLDTGIFTIYAGTSYKNFEQVVVLIKTELGKLCQEKIVSNELHRAKEQLKGNLLLSLENSCNRMSRIAKNELFRDRLLSPDQIVEQIEMVTSEDLLRIAQNLFSKEQVVLAALGPFESDSAWLRKEYRDY